MKIRVPLRLLSKVEQVEALVDGDVGRTGQFSLVEMVQVIFLNPRTIALVLVLIMEQTPTQVSRLILVVNCGLENHRKLVEEVPLLVKSLFLFDLANEVVLGVVQVFLGIQDRAERVRSFRAIRLAEVLVEGVADLVVGHLVAEVDDQQIARHPGQVQD